ncbi:hypothetical protein D3C72_1897040 [compost metagenome]
MPGVAMPTAADDVLNQLARGSHGDQRKLTNHAVNGDLGALLKAVSGCRDGGLDTNICQHSRTDSVRLACARVLLPELGPGRFSDPSHLPWLQKPIELACANNECKDGNRPRKDQEGAAS